MEKFSPVQVCKHRSKFEAEKNPNTSVVCLRTKYHQSRTTGSLGPYGISKIQISHSRVHRLSPSFSTTTMNAEHLSADQFDILREEYIPLGIIFIKLKLYFFPF